MATDRPTTTKRYRVNWTTEVDSVNAWEAALAAWQQLRTPGIAPTLTVSDPRERDRSTLDVQQVLDHLYLGRPIYNKAGEEGTVVAVIPTCEHCHLFCVVPSWGAHSPKAGPCISLFEERVPGGALVMTTHSDMSTKQQTAKEAR